MVRTEFSVESGGRSLTCALASPAENELADDAALLLSFSGTRQSTMDSPAQNMGVEGFVAAGHRALSFDLPNHGDNVDSFGEGITGMCAAFVGGNDPFTRFVADGRVVIDACVERGLGRPGRIYVCGVSRGGYCALRLAAADERIGGAAGLAPVTDWRILREFAPVRERAEVGGLALGHWAEELAGRPVFLAIGNHDHRVGTHACTGLARRLFELEEPEEEGDSAICLHVVDSAGHALAEEWRLEGVRFLLRLATRAGRIDKEKANAGEEN